MFMEALRALPALPFPFPGQQQHRLGEVMHDREPDELVLEDPKVKHTTFRSSLAITIGRTFGSAPMRARTEAARISSFTLSGSSDWLQPLSRQHRRGSARRVLDDLGRQPACRPVLDRRSEIVEAHGQAQARGDLQVGRVRGLAPEDAFLYPVVDFRRHPRQCGNAATRQRRCAPPRNAPPVSQGGVVWLSLRSGDCLTHTA